MNVVDFFDSNIFIYLVDEANPAKQATAERLIALALAENSACISFQVVQETLHVLTRKFSRCVPPEVVTAILNHSLLPFWHVQPSAALYVRTLELQERYQYSFYDSLILAAALESGCTRLLSEEFQDGQRIEGLTIENPFKD